MKVLYRIAAYIVDFGKDMHAVFLEQPRAIQYAAHSHGVMRPLFERVEINEDDKEVPDGSSPPTH